jgi:hypothetical protein
MILVLLPHLGFTHCISFESWQIMNHLQNPYENNQAPHAWPGFQMTPHPSLAPSIIIQVSSSSFKLAHTLINNKFFSSSLLWHLTWHLSNTIDTQSEHSTTNCIR